MHAPIRGERLSDGLNTNIKKSKKLYRLSQQTYKDIVKLFEKPDNIKEAEIKIMKALKDEEDEINKQRSKKFEERFAKAVKMPKTRSYKKAA